MAKRCDICKKGALTGYRVSHANNRTKRRTMPNLKRVHAIVNGAAKRIRACTRCIRTGLVVKAA